MEEEPMIPPKRFDIFPPDYVGDPLFPLVLNTV